MIESTVKILAQRPTHISAVATVLLITKTFTMKETDRQTADRHIQTDRERETQRDAETQRQTDIESQRNKDRNRERERESIHIYNFHLKADKLSIKNRNGSVKKNIQQQQQQQQQQQKDGCCAQL